MVRSVTNLKYFMSRFQVKREGHRREVNEISNQVHNQLEDIRWENGFQTGAPLPGAFILESTLSDVKLFIAIVFAQNFSRPDA